MRPVLVTTPATTKAWLQERIQAAEKTILVVSPYVGDILRTALLERPSKVEARLVTNLKVGDVVGGSCDIRAVHALSTNRVQVQSISNLHAKVYLIDSQDILVTSANATSGGWQGNLEMGLAVKDTEIAQQILQTIRQAKPYPWTTAELKRYADWAAAQPKPAPKPRLPSTEVIKGAFEGWLELTISGVEQLPEEFALAEAYAKLLPLAAVHYPNNKNPEAKIRQQLQGMRDLGLLEFVGTGRYRRLTVQNMAI